eukprot:6086057-Pyramimonas_sp.AAC.1
MGVESSRLPPLAFFLVGGFDLIVAPQIESLTPSGALPVGGGVRSDSGQRSGDSTRGGHLCSHHARYVLKHS